MQRYVLAFASLLAACSSEEKKPEKSPKHEVEHLSENAVSQGTLSGTYYSACLPIKKGSKLYGIKKHVYGRDLTLEGAGYLFFDSSCSRLLSVTEFAGRYVIGGKSKAVQGFTEIDGESAPTYLTVHDQEMADALREDDECPVDARIGERVKYVACSEEGGGLQRQIFSKEGDALRFGDSEGLGDSERPTKISPHKYTKKVPDQIKDLD